MKTYQAILTTSIIAGEDIPKGRFVGFDGRLCGANAKALGVSEVDVNQGQPCPVIVYGIAIVETGGAVSVGDAVTSDNNGRAVVAGVDPVINGYALDSATQAGQFIRVKLV